MIGPGFDEAEVRRLCGEAAFTRADLIERSGGVLGPTSGPDPTRRAILLTADVRGLWRHVDRAKAVIQGGRITPTCGCGAAGVCRHVGALLLHWLRDPSAFDPDQPSPGGTPPPDLSAASSAFVDVATAELAALLERETMPRLRELARERGLAARAGNKADLIAQLAPALAEPAGVDAALAGLTHDQRRVLDTADLVGVLGLPTDAVLAANHAVLGGRPSLPPLDRLVVLGLLMRQHVSNYYPPHYTLPDAVRRRLPRRDDLLPALRKSPPARPVPLDVDALILVIVHDLAGHDVRWRAGPPPTEYPGSVLAGWRIDMGEHSGVRLADLLQERPVPSVRLFPLMPSLAETDLARLAARSGAPPAMVGFVFRMLATLGIVEGGDRLRVRADALPGLLGLDRARRIEALVGIWLTVRDWTELTLIVGPDGPLQVRYRPTYSSVEDALARGVGVMRQVVVRLLGRLAPDAWYGVDQLVDLLRGLTPRPLVPHVRSASAPWFADRTGQVPLHTHTPEGWDMVARVLVGALLDGPLSWLGLVEVAGEDGRVDAFRVRPAAGVLAGRDVPSDEVVARLSIADDLTVRVPVGGGDADTYGWLNRLGELIEVSPAGVSYRLTPERVQAAFDDGWTGPGLLDLLTAASDGPLPAAARAAVERWWSGYGAARLYDDVCLVELGDDFLLPELLATTPLATWLVHTFSPRLIAIDPGAVDELVAALARVGHAPRVVEGA